MFRLADGCLMSAKKDGMVNIGGFLALNDGAWVEAAKRCSFSPRASPPTAASPAATWRRWRWAWRRACDEDYLRYRLRTAEYMGEKMKAGGVAFVEPTGGHAVYIDAKRLPAPPAAGAVSRLEPLANALYLEAGIRGVEIGSVMFGKHNDDGTESYHGMELVRLAFPRRMYTQSHFDYAAEAICELKATCPRGARGDDGEAGPVPAPLHRGVHLRLIASLVPSYPRTLVLSYPRTVVIPPASD